MQIPKATREKPCVLKVCAFPDCDEMIYAINKTKYCEEHKKKKYFDALYTSKYKKEREENNQNQRINHTFSEDVTRIQKCECCGESFKITIIPRVFIYPKYCSDHINEHKRIMYERNKSER